MAQVAYGIRIESDMAIDGLPEPCGDEIAAVHVYEDHSLRSAMHASPDAEVEFLGCPLRLFLNGALEARWGERAYYRIGVGEPQIRCAFGPEGNFVRMQQWLLHWALPLYGVVGRHLELLHGGSVQVGDSAIAFLAASGIGKSTIVEHFARRGHGFLTDDKLVIVRRGGRYFSVPSSPFVATDELKLHWRRSPNYVPGMLPLSGLYVLKPADAAAVAAIEPLDPARAAFELGCRSEVRLPENVRTRLGLPRPGFDGFAYYCELAAHLRVSRLIVPRALSRLPEVYDAVIADVEKHA